MKQNLDLEIKVGIFTSVGVGLILLAIMVLGGADGIINSHNEYTIHFSNASGMVQGAKVELHGIRIGIVKGVEFDPQTRDVEVTIQVTSKYAQWIRQDTKAEINTQGVLGDKFISLTAGTLDQPELPNESKIPAVDSKQLKDFLNDGDKLLSSLNRIATSLDALLASFQKEDRSDRFFKGMAETSTNLSKLTATLNQMELKSTVHHLNSIMEKIDNGSGTLGALINDPSLYDDAKSLVSGINRNRIMRNLVRKTIRDAKEVEGKN